MPRKTTGCWTCRARKKKCDDGRPSCAACTMRAITCYGYDAKPAWMDGADEEKNMLLTMKQRAKESYSQRRRARAMRSARQGSMTTSTASPGGIRSDFGESPTTATAARSDTGSRDIQDQPQAQQPDGPQFDMRSADQSSPNDDSTHSHQNHQHHQNHQNHSSHRDFLNHPGHHGLHSGHHGHPGPMEPHASYTAHPSYPSHAAHIPHSNSHSHSLPHTSHPSQGFYDPRHYQDAPLPPLSHRPRSQSPSLLPPQRMAAGGTSVTNTDSGHSHTLAGSVSGPSTGPAASTAARSGSDFPYSEGELSLLMYYFDHVFPRLCPFFKYSAGDKGRGWLLSLFLRTKPLCAAAICISACDQAQFKLGPLSDIPLGTNHDLEMQHIDILADLRAHLAQLSQQTGAGRMAVAVEALACVMHLILFELWIPRHGEPNDWVVHLDAAAALLSSVDTSIANGSTTSSDSPMSMSMSMSMSTPSDISRSGGGGASNNNNNNAEARDDPAIQEFFPVSFLSDCEASAFNFFLTQYTYCFVASAVGHELTPQSVESIQRTHSIFHRNQTKIRDMFGLEDWVLTTMLDVAVLKAWKQRERSAGTLSLRELTRRADVLEARISEGIARMAATDTAAALAELASPVPSTVTVGGPRAARPSRDEKSYMVTSTYLHATLLFLHIVVSGFYPNLPEIRRAVLHTLEALEFMRANCDQNIPSWPFCVAGCLALESEYPRFQALSPAPQVDQHPLVLTKWTLSIIERCWQMRAAQPNKGEETVDWVTAMNDLGTRLLLL